MEITTDNATSDSMREVTLITSVEPVSDLNNSIVIPITVMEPEFYKAAVKGEIDVFERKGEPIESILTPNKNTILHIHLTQYDKGSGTFVEKVLGMCPSLILKTNVKGDTLLHIAARYGHHEIVKKLIDYAKGHKAGAEKELIRAINDKKDTALHEAARYGHNEVVDVLIKEEPDHTFFGKNVDDETPLYIAVEKQYWNVFDTILDKSSSPQYDGPNGRTALHAAVLLSDKGIIAPKLLTKNLSVAKQADENGWIPLHLAALCADSHVVGQLVSKDRSTAYMRDNKGRTALHFAALGGNTSAMEKIIEYCPDCCELVDEKGLNALHYTTMAEAGYTVGLAKLIQDAPLRKLCNEKDDDGNTPLHLLAHQAPKWKDYYHHPLLNRDISKVDTMAFNKYGQTALDVAMDVVPSISAFKNKMLWKLRTIGASLGGRVLDKQVKEKKKEKRCDVAVGEKEEEYETRGEDRSARMATTLSVVATLIATVTFTAGFTLPGGMIQEGEHQGSPILKYNAAFISFVLTDSLSFILSTSAVLLLFLSSVVTDGWEEFSEALLTNCGYLTMGAMAFMIVAFGTGTYAVLGISKGFGIVTLFIVLSFFFIIVIVFGRALKLVRKSGDVVEAVAALYFHRRERNIQLSQIL